MRIEIADQNYRLRGERSLMMFSAIATLVAMLTMVLFPVLIPVVLSGVHFAAKPRRKPMDRRATVSNSTLVRPGRVSREADGRHRVTRSVIAQG
jgi:hypothetical protein